MTKEQCSLQPNYYGSSCDFQDLQSAVQQLTTKSDAQFEELKNEKWFHRIFKYGGLSQKKQYPHGRADHFFGTGTGNPD